MITQSKLLPFNFYLDSEGVDYVDIFPNFYNSKTIIGDNVIKNRYFISGVAYSFILFSVEEPAVLSTFSSTITVERLLTTSIGDYWKVTIVFNEDGCGTVSWSGDNTRYTSDEFDVLSAASANIKKFPVHLEFSNPRNEFGYIFGAFDVKFYVPSYDEAVTMIDQSSSHPLSHSVYWSSTEADSSSAWIVEDTGTIVPGIKTAAYGLRLVARVGNNGYSIGDVITIAGTELFVIEVVDSQTVLCSKTEDETGTYQWGDSVSNITATGAVSTSDGLANTNTLIALSPTGGTAYRANLSRESALEIEYFGIHLEAFNVSPIVFTERNTFENINYISEITKSTQNDGIKLSVSCDNNTMIMLNAILGCKYIRLNGVEHTCPEGVEIEQAASATDFGTATFQLQRRNVDYSATFTDDGKYSGGTGTAVYPYLISTSADLVELSATASDWSGKYFLQINDIDVNSIAWVPIATLTNQFNSTYVGGLHSINGLTSTASRSGMFAYIGASGVVGSVVLSNAVITSSLYAGMIAGENYGAIENCTVEGSVYASAYAGGIVGYVLGGSISKCKASGTVTASSTAGSAGGIIGYNTDGSCLNSYSLCNASANTAGGAIGVGQSGSIENCYSIGTANGETNEGGLIGFKLGAYSVTSSYWDTQTSGNITSAGGIGKTTLEMKTPSTFVGWSTSIWNLITGFYPTLK